MIINSHNLNSFNIKKIIVIFLGLVLISSFVPLQSVYAASVIIPSTATNLSNFATTDSETPDIFSSGDNVYVVWRENDDIRFVNSTNGETFPNAAIDIGDTTSSSFSGDPKISVDGDDIYVVWREGSSVKFIDSNDNGVNFAGAVVEVSSSTTTTSNRDPQVTFSDSNAAHVVWRDREGSTDNRILFAKSPDNGASFNNIMEIDADSDSSSPDPQIAAFGTKVYVVWQDATDILVAESTNNGNSFSTVTDIGDSSGASLQSLPQIAIDSSDNVYVVWQQSTDIKAAIKQSGSSFGSSSTIGSVGAATGIPSQIVTSGSNAYVVWQDNNVGSGDVKFAKSTNAASFGSETNLSDNAGLSTLPQITSSGTSVFVVWRDLTSDSSGDILIKASDDSGDTFPSGAGDNVSSTNGDTSIEPVISTSGSKAFVAWKDSNPGNNDILFKPITLSSISVGFDTSQYRLGETATISVTDAGFSGAGTIIVNVKSTTTDPSTLPITLTETTPGTFTGTISFTESGISSGTTLQAIAGDTITASFEGTDATASIFSKSIDFGGITLFNLGSTAHVKVTDQNANLDSGIAETVTVNVISTANPTGISLTLTETGVDTGIFGGSSGPTQSDLIFTEGSGLLARDTTSSITITQTDGSNSAGSNVDSNVIDQVTVDIISTSDPTGISLVLNETSKDTAIFSKDLLVSTVSSNQTTGTILISAGDVITVTNRAGTPQFSKLLVTPASPQDGALDVTTPSDTNIKATYNPSITVTLNDPFAPGGGGGGLVSPGLVVNALAGLGGGGGGGSPLTSLNNLLTSPVIYVPEEVKQMVVNHDSYSPILPMDPESFEGFDFPLVINDQGFVLGGFSNTLQTSTIKTDTTISMKFTVYTADKIQHFSLYTNLRDANDSIAKSDTQILYNDGKDLQIKDPNGLFSDAKINVIEEEDSVKKQIHVEMTFVKEMDTSHIITRMWDSHLRSGDMHILDAIKVESEEPEFIPIPQETEEVQVEELKSQIIPKWVKNNAEWWVDKQIDDESFITGIQYLINNGIMYVPNAEPVNSSVTEIPDWVRNNAEWWGDNQISDDDFVMAMEWLVSNGVISLE